MLAECDRSIKLSIPAIRISVAQLLEKEYRLDQQTIAMRLGVTQAAVSKYLNGKHSYTTFVLMDFIKKRGIDRKIAKLIASGCNIKEVNLQIDRAASSPYILKGASKLYH